jgi:hypothetical protein
VPEDPLSIFGGLGVCLGFGGLAFFPAMMSLI